MIPLPPAPTLFPYTTLFRSLMSDGVPSRAHVYTPIRIRPRSTNNVGLEICGDSRQCSRVHKRLICLRARAKQSDRKSTRLNSSHVEISYAVFCLKKKNETDYSRQLLADQDAPACPCVSGRQRRDVHRCDAALGLVVLVRHGRLDRAGLVGGVARD